MGVLRPQSHALQLLACRIPLLYQRIQRQNCLRIYFNAELNNSDINVLVRFMRAARSLRNIVGALSTVTDDSKGDRVGNNSGS